MGLERGQCEMYVAGGDCVFRDGLGRAVEKGIFGMPELRPHTTWCWLVAVLNSCCMVMIMGLWSFFFRSVSLFLYTSNTSRRARTPAVYCTNPPTTCLLV